MFKPSFILCCFYFLGSLVLKAQSVQFAEVSSSVGIIDVNQLIYIYGSGASVVDYDKDGDLDIFVGTEFGENNQFYRNLGNGQFEEIADAVGLKSTYRNRTGLWFDYNGDQRLDVLMLGDCYQQGCGDPIVPNLFEQNADGTFTDVTASTDIDFGTKYVSTVANAVGGSSAADINNDGYLDVLVSVWGGELTLFLNDGDGTFTDISSPSGLGATSKSRWQPIFYDFNQDGFIDFYCNIDFDANELWLNNGDNTFTEVAVSVGAASAYNEMGVTLGDYDNDGDMDIYATNISRMDNGVLRHNILLRNNWSGTNVLGFTEVANSLGVGASGWDWGTTFFDANNDGNLDLGLTNGWGPSSYPDDNSRLWLNLGDGLFGDISTTASFNDNLDAATLLAFDMDRDGDLDLLQSLKQNTGETKAIKLYENQHNSTANPGNYLVVKPRMNGTNHFAIGTVVKITANGLSSMRLITAGTSFYGQEPAEAFFGLDANTIVDEVRVEWPDNTVTVIQDVGVNQVITVTNDVVLSTPNDSLYEVRVFPNPTNSVLNIQYKEVVSSVSIYNLLGQELIMKSTNHSNVDIDVSILQPGTYFIKVETINNTNIKPQRFIKK